MEWKTESGLVAYDAALAEMAARVAAIQRGEVEELAWLLEHPPLYTAGTSAKAADLLRPQFPVFETGRGGQYTYHGPGQRVAYVLRDLKRRDEMDIRAYVKKLEQWIILTLAEFGIEGFVREGRVGVWVCRKPEVGSRKSEKNTIHDSPFTIHLVAEGEPLAAGVGGNAAKGGQAPLQKELKIAAIGVRVQKWVTSHGIALNVDPDLAHYAGIVPCGIRDHGVTSLAAMGVDTSMQEVDAVLKATFGEVFSYS
jgi:lipoyl(octanoyl) transferase